MKLFKKIEAEAIEAIPSFIYFAICFNLIHFIGILSRQPGDIRYYTFIGVMVLALVVAKTIVIANFFPFINAFPNKPLIYNIVWKLFIYNLFLLLVRLLDIFVHMTIHHGYDSAMAKLVYEISLPMFWASELCVVFVFLGFVTMNEFVRVLGKAKVIKMVFG